MIIGYSTDINVILMKKIEVIEKTSDNPNQKGRLIEK